MKKIEFVVLLTLLTIASLSTSTFAQTRPGLLPSHPSSQVANRLTDTFGQTQNQSNQLFQDTFGNLSTGLLAPIQHQRNQLSQTVSEIQRPNNSFPISLNDPCLYASSLRGCNQTGEIFIPSVGFPISLNDPCLYASSLRGCNQTGEIFIPSVGFPISFNDPCLYASSLRGCNQTGEIFVPTDDLIFSVDDPCLRALFSDLRDCNQTGEGMMSNSNPDVDVEGDFTVTYRYIAPPEPPKEQPEVNQETVARSEAAAQVHQEQVQREEDERARKQQAADEANRLATEQKRRAEESERNAEIARKQASSSQNEKDIAKANAAQASADEDQRKTEIFATNVFIANLLLKIQTVKVETLQADAREAQTVADNLVRQFVAQQPLGQPFVPDETNHGMHGGTNVESNFVSRYGNLLGVPLVSQTLNIAGTTRTVTKMIPVGRIIPPNLVNYSFRFPYEASVLNLLTNKYNLTLDQLLAFKNEELGRFKGDDFLMIPRLANILHYAAVEFAVRYPDYAIAVTEALDRQGEHSSYSNHYGGSALDLTIIDRLTGLKVIDSQTLEAKLGGLGRIVTQQGADFVHFELPNGYGSDHWHIHVSTRHYYFVP